VGVEGAKSGPFPVTLARFAQPGGVVGVVGPSGTRLPAAYGGGVDVEEAGEIPQGEPLVFAEELPLAAGLPFWNSHLTFDRVVCWRGVVEVLGVTEADLEPGLVVFVPGSGDGEPPRGRRWDQLPLNGGCVAVG
jgi:hypothetical protein